MMLKSMTGFGRAEGQAHGVGWVWELRSVNGKSLDVRLRLPPGFERLEQGARKLAAQKLSRGNIQASLTLQQQNNAGQMVLNEAVLAGVLDAINKIESRSERSPSSAADILAIRGVLETGDPSLPEEDQKALEANLLVSLGNALDGLNEHRAREGAALAEIMTRLLDSITGLTLAAEQDPARTPQAIAARLQEQVDRISGGNGGFDDDRLHQEVALLATKADIREELDRLAAHIEAARELIEAGSPVGRKLEFLTQEFNRECNTLCSKANAVSLTNTGLEMKVVIDQLREQCLNVE
ncbi:MAG: YicC/YloC family endoribonuclease [Rhizobiaceae bacterium]